jgi:hypothetical protein
MKPAWDKIMEEFKDHKSTLVADVDCTADGKALCDQVGVRGYPTIKHGDPANLDDYQGGRDEAALRTFAAGLKPVCSPSQLDLCDAEGKAKIEKVMAMDDAEISKFIADGEKQLLDAEEAFKKGVERLQSEYKEMQDAKEAKSAEIKAAGLGLYKSVLAHKKKNPDAKKEL